MGKVAVTDSPAAKPRASLPNAWVQPAGSLLDGKCGITGVSNMLRLYGIETDPSSIDLSKFRSWGPGLRRDKFAEDLNELGGGKTFFSRSLPEGTDALARLRQHMAAQEPVAIQYMTSQDLGTNAHWVVVVDVQGGTNPNLTYMSWGGYRTMKWDDMKDPWKRGWGGPYPHVVGQGAASKW